jgi:hypothetical protein
VLTHSSRQNGAKGPGFVATVMQAILRPIESMAWICRNGDAGDRPV